MRRRKLVLLIPLIDFHILNTYSAFDILPYLDTSLARSNVQIANHIQRSIYKGIHEGVKLALRTNMDSVCGQKLSLKFEIKRITPYQN